MDDYNKRFSDEEWKALSAEQRSEILKKRKEGKGKDGKVDANGVPWKNDWKFYALSEQVAKDQGSIPYNVMSGVGFNNTIRRIAAQGTQFILDVPRQREMCAFVVNYVPTCGWAEEKTDGINMSATQLYTAVRRRNSGAKNYDAVDLMMYVLAMKAIYIEYFELKRALGLVQLYEIENHYLPDLLLNACGFDAEDLRDNIAQYRGKLNVMATKINAFAVPKYFKAFDRAAYIASKVFADSTSIRGQYYILRTLGYHVFDTTSDPNGTRLTWNDHPTTPSVQQSWLVRFNELKAMVDAMYLDTDANTMSGDILKKFGVGNCYAVVPTSEDYVVVPEMDEDILAQIENSIGASSFAPTVGEADEPSFNITQSGQLVQFMPAWTNVSGGPSDGVTVDVLNKWYFNSHKDAPDYKDTLEWSRLITVPKLITNPSNDSEVTSIQLRGFGLELVINYRIYSYMQDSGGLATGSINNIYDYTEITTLGASLAIAMAKLGQFDWHPGVYIISKQGDLPAHIDVMMDLKKFTAVSEAEITPIHESAVTASFWAEEIYNTTSDES